MQKNGVHNFHLHDFTFSFVESKIISNAVNYPAYENDYLTGALRDEILNTTYLKCILIATADPRTLTVELKRIDVTKVKEIIGQLQEDLSKPKLLKPTA